jgi:hypothetical protein
VVGVAAGGAVVALAAGGAGLPLAPADLGEGSVQAIRRAGAAAAAVGLVGLLVHRWRVRSIGGPVRDPRDRPPDPAGAALLTAAKVMGLIALVVLLSPRGIREAPPERIAADGIGIDTTAAPPEEPPPPGAFETPPVTQGFQLEDDLAGDDPRITLRDPRPPAAEAAAPASERGFFGHPRGLLLSALLAVLAVIGLVALRERLRGRRPDVDPAAETVEDAAAGLAASLEAIARGPGDPRRRITASYRRLLVALDELGASRLPHEAPHEHLWRALGPLGVRPEPMHRLARLYVAAQFGEAPVTEAERAAAAEALEAGLADLRAGHDARGAGLAGPRAGNGAREDGP